MILSRHMKVAALADPSKYMRHFAKSCIIVQVKPELLVYEDTKNLIVVAITITQLAHPSTSFFHLLF